MKFRGSSGKLYRLSEIHRDMHAYVQVNDTILDEVKYCVEIFKVNFFGGYFCEFNSQNSKFYNGIFCPIHMKTSPYSFVFQVYRSEKPELQEARSIVDKIQKRDIPMKLVQCNYSNSTIVRFTEIYLFAQYSN